jgi:membrane-bound lytic murein transglycosylase D
MASRLSMLLAALLGVGCATERAYPPAQPSGPVAGTAVSPPEDDAAAPTATVGPVPELPCIAAPAIDAWEERLRPKRHLWERMVHSPGRGGSSHSAVQRLVAEARMPPGLALLPAIESGYRATAEGPRGSRGLWQLGRSTARNYGLVVDARRDDRVDVGRSTRAALRLLRDLRTKYASWPLALAAYNAGEGRVDRALRARPKASFWDLAAARLLPPVTRKYVPKFLALVRLLQPEAACPERGLVVAATGITEGPVRAAPPPRPLPDR